ncbi:MAG: ankyrin repeat domain-containing protein, partial [Pyramidobacter sp.]|nr:ankyrin repeat domain-containing protein [Pyramidobacter sp.]
MKLKIILAAALMSAACAFASADDPYADLPEETQAVELPELAQTAADDIARLAAGGVNARARDGSTPLMLAARTGDTQLVRSLLNGGAKVNARNKKGTTALMNAAFFREDAEIARLLIAAGANVNAADKEGWTPLMLALYASESTETAEALVAAGADVNARNKNGWTPLMCALRSGKPAAFITKMLRSWKVHAEEHKNARDGTTPLMIACQYASDPSVVKRLYAAGGEATRARNNGDRPLHFAARNETGAAPAIIQFLLDSRADINGKGSGGWTPLMAAAQFSSHPETVKKMLDAGAVVNARKNDGMTAVMLAATNESPAAEQIASLLIYAGADLDATDGRGRRAYHVAARSAHSLEML